MFKMKSLDRYADLPEPMALSAEQLKEVATQTAGGGMSLATSVMAGIICGGRPALDALIAPSIPSVNVTQQFR